MSHQIYNTYFKTRKIFLGTVNPQLLQALKSVKIQRTLTQCGLVDN